MGAFARNTLAAFGLGLALVTLLTPASTLYAQPEDAAEGPDKSRAVARGEVHIQSEQLVIETQANTARFEGGVVVRHGELVLKCERLDADYDTKGDPIRLTATGKVKMSRGSLFATASRAVYQRAGKGAQASGTVELTGTPQVWRGPHRLTGARVVIDLDSGKIEVDTPKGVLDWPERADSSP